MKDLLAQAARMVRDALNGRSPRQAILDIITASPGIHGRAIRDRMGRPVWPSLYVHLMALERDGLIRSERLDDSGRRGYHLNPTPSADREGFFRWTGGECPVDENALVDVRMDNGMVIHQQRAGAKYWESGKEPGQQIVAYRLSVIQEKSTPKTAPPIPPRRPPASADESVEACKNCRWFKADETDGLMIQHLIILQRAGRSPSTADVLGYGQHNKDGMCTVLPTRVAKDEDDLCGQFKRAEHQEDKR